MAKTIGGFSSIRYVTGVAAEVGILNFVRAVGSRNTCKTCAYGMGGQKGGMRNEAGTWLEICKKSVQAQLTDIQAGIPEDFFRDQNIKYLKGLAPRKLERLGRLNSPLYKAAGDSHYTPLTWDEAMDKAISRFKETDPARSFFYASGRSSNEAAFLLQLFVRLYGTNNVNNCSYYCHQASGVGIASTIGTGTATIQLEDIKGSDLIFVIGANPASNHPRFMTELLHCRRRGGNVVVINPAREPGLEKFAIPSDIRSMLTGGSRIASHFVQPNIGGDVAVMKGIAKHILEHEKQDEEFIRSHTNGFEDYKQDVMDTSWEDIQKSGGISKEKLLELSELYLRAKNVIFAWAMGITHHTNGVENVESIVDLALLRGMVGKPQAGLLPLRGHSNVQGVGSVGVTPALKEQVFRNIESKLGVKLPETAGMDTMACMHAAHAGDIDTALFLGGNLLAATPDQGFAEAAFDKIPFKIFLTTTLNQSHVNGISQEVLVLPVAARDEEKQSTTQESMFSFVRLSDGGIVRLDNVRSEVDIISGIAAAVVEREVLDFSAFADHQNIRKAIAATVPGFSKMGALGAGGEEFHIEGRTFHTPEFATPDKKANFRVVNIPQHDKNKDEFLLTTVRSEGQFNTIVYEEEDKFRGQSSRWIVMMSPEDMSSRGLTEGTRVALQSDTGTMPGVQVREFNLPPGNLMAYFPEANVLTGNQIDKRSKTPGFKSTVVKLLSPELTQPQGEEQQDSQQG